MSTRDGKSKLHSGRDDRDGRASDGRRRRETQIDWLTAKEAAYREGYEAGQEDEALGVSAADERWAQSEAKAGD